MTNINTLVSHWLTSSMLKNPYRIPPVDRSQKARDELAHRMASELAETMRKNAPNQEIARLIDEVA